MTHNESTQAAEAAKLKAIYQARKKADPDLTQEALAEKAGWAGQSVVSQYLNGRIPLNLPALLKFASMLNFAPEQVSSRLASQLALVGQGTESGDSRGPLSEFPEHRSNIRRANLALLLDTRFDGNKSALGRAVGRQAGYVAGMLPDSKNARSVGEANARAFEQKLGLPAGWLDQPHEFASTEHANVKPSLQPHREAREYPVISWVAAGSWSEACEIHHPGIADEWLASHENAGQCGYWLEVNGDSMAPPTGFGFASGLFILVQPEGFDLVSGKYYIAKLIDTGETTFKQYVRDAGVEYLRPLNPAFRTMEITDNVQIIGRVIDARPPRSVF